RPMGLAKAYAPLAIEPAGPRAIAARLTERNCDPRRLTVLAAFVLEMRRNRDAYFPDGLFGEPAWDVLLVLFAAGERKQELHQAEVIALAHVPKTTAGRVFARLEEDGLVGRRKGRDIRKRYLALTEDGRKRMTS
ncbi:hypothetical protein, partial [Staphylococcus aureus]|uniref:hypothetical protein n=1 Tax=Staphylococcus aureus TaxID=1280 RepID=UPI0039BE23B4